MPRPTRASAAVGASNSAGLPSENHIDSPQIKMEMTPPRNHRSGLSRTKLEVAEATETAEAPAVDISTVSRATKSTSLEISDAEGGDLYGTDSDGISEDPISTASRITTSKKSKVADEDFHNIDGSSDLEQETNHSSGSRLPAGSELSQVAKGKKIDLPRDEDMLDVDQIADNDSDSEPLEWTDDDQILLDATYPQELAL
ncbi:uncharacterized protein EAE97_004001 [Botrytis byssoidea]|uniref:Uncharacterized protein n=1 Tax=Botrytis byssoidea TaxID=139641 RepID=A0A9P5IP39_9HELO|nr:uncharacterized protein EAE97_004001 [Botrytis byssoidea]KAF7948590.1 hypothetical protein EAE97_004001 [Botrytis byssoidea]